MAGTTRETIDPVDAAEVDIGSSRKLIAATLDDLSKHHSWLETYHRDERLRAERLRRQEQIEGLEATRQRTVRRLEDAVRTAAERGAVSAGVIRQQVSAFARWARPRVRLASRRAARAGAAAWSWSRQHAPVYMRQARAGATRGFNCSVQASEEAGFIFRRRLAQLSADAGVEGARLSAPMRRRVKVGLTRAQRDLGRHRARLERQAVEAAATSETIAAIRKAAHRGTIRGLRLARDIGSRAALYGLALEETVSKRIIRAAPDLSRLLKANMPDTLQANHTGSALIVRPGTAVACIAPRGNRLPALRA